MENIGISHSTAMNEGLLYKYYIPVGFPPGITSPSEGVARGRQSSRGDVIPGGNPTGISYLFYYTEQIQNTKR